MPNLIWEEIGYLFTKLINIADTFFFIQSFEDNIKPFTSVPPHRELTA